MKKFLRVLGASTLAVAVSACSGTTASTSGSAVKGSSEIAGTYTRYVQGDDWGAGVSSVVVTLDNPVDAVDAKTFAVSETKDDTDWSDYSTKSFTNERTVTDAYLVDEDGNKTTEPSKNVKIELGISPSEGSPFQYSVVTGRNAWTPYEMNITLAEGAALTSGGTAVESFTVNPEFTATLTSADEFKYDSYKAEDGTEYEYAYYEPEEKSETLVVWLHGGGEGGGDGVTTDPSVVLLANEAANLGGEDFQKAVGGANVLVPQCPTYWIDDGNFAPGASADDVVMKNSGTSLYTESLVELIDSYKEKTESKKVVLVGCSNGGFMTLLLGKTYPEKYDVLVPICGPLSLDKFTDDEIASLKDKPMFFVWADADTTVPPESFEVPTLAKFEAEGFTNLKKFHPATVVDTTDRFKTEDGSAYEYAGHWSWIYFFNGEAVDEDGTSAWDFIAENVK